MARQEIILGTPPQGLGGDPPRVASMKINAMTQEIFDNLPTTAAPLPINKGGTGAKSKELAQAALGIPNNGAPLSVLSGGNGGVTGQYIPGANANSATLGNGSYITDSEWVGSPFAGSTPFNQGYLDMNWWGPGFAVQTWTSLGSVSTASGRGPLRRWLYNGAFGAWGSPDLAYTPANSVGAVSQAAGVPTGALMQYLSTANGECWRFASGLQICTISVTTGAVNLAASSVFTCAAQSVGGFPANFIVAPKVTSLGVVVGSGGGWGSCYSFPTASSWGAWAVYNHLSNSGPSRIDLIAVGRWF